MLSIQDYLLLKLSEESNELANELMLLNIKETASTGSAFDHESISESLEKVHAEFNDLLAIAAMLPRAFPDFDIEGKTKEQANGIKKVSLDWATTQSLDVAHIVSKCLIFGTEDSYKNEANITRLSTSIAILRRIVTLVLSQYACLDSSNYENIEMQINKREKVLHFMQRSFTNHRIEKVAINEFTNINSIIKGESGQQSQCH